MSFKPIIAITMGDPAGVGPEIVAKIAQEDELFSFCRPLLIGSADIMRKIVHDLRFEVAVRRIETVSNADPKPGTVEVFDVGIGLADHAWGVPNAATGHAAVDYVKQAVALAHAGQIEAIVTAPISKAAMNAAGFRYAGHTELLADLTHTMDYGMLFVGGGLRVMLVTIHVALENVPSLVTRESVLASIRLAHRAMRYFGMPRPRIGIAALNPHAGEGGLFGAEEQERILPAVQQARREGIDASEPIPADTLFHQARNKQYDVVVAMYHDQGLAPLKMLAFGNSVNVTVGLPIIRTSVDHGTAFDIAGKGVASLSSLMEAARLAAKMALHRRTEPKERP